MSSIRDRHRRVAPPGHPDLFGPEDADALNPDRLPAPPSVPVITRAHDSAVEALMVIRQMVDAAITQVQQADSDSRHATAVFTLGALDRIESAASGLKQSAIVATCDDADESLRAEPDPDPDGEAPRRPVITAARAASYSIGAALLIGDRAAEYRIADAERIVRLLPRAHARMVAGDYTPRHTRVILDALEHLGEPEYDEVIRDLDAALFTRPGRMDIPTLRRRVGRWLLRHNLPTEAQVRRREGSEDRYVAFGPVDLWQMRPFSGYLDTTAATSIEATLSTLAATAPVDDPRTLGQKMADALTGVFTGPAALATGLAAQLGGEPPPLLHIDPQRPGAIHTGPGGWPAVEDRQAAIAADTWQTIILLAASLGFTFPAPPPSAANVHVPLDVLTRLQEQAAARGHPPNGPPSDDANTGARADSEAGADGDAGADADAEAGAGAGAADIIPRVEGLGDIDDAHARLLLQHAATLRRIITDPISQQPLNVGRTQRFAPPKMADRIQTRDQNCRYPGCHRPATARIQFDHAVPWSSGGHTADANTMVLCTNHHVAKTSTHWTAQLNPLTGEVRWSNHLLGLTRTTTCPTWT